MDINLFAVVGDRYFFVTGYHVTAVMHDQSS